MRGDAMKNTSEYQEQAAVFRWAEIAQKSQPELQLLFGSLNGVRLSIGAAVKAKRCGLKRGYPDILLDVPRGPYHGLRIEMKITGGRLLPDQKCIIDALREQGYCVAVCFGAMDAIDAIQKYLNIKPA
jgi:hypothetical protein